MIASIGRRIGSVGARIGGRRGGIVVVANPDGSLTVIITDQSEIETGHRFELGIDGVSYSITALEPASPGKGLEVSHTFTGLSANTKYWARAYTVRDGYPDSEVLGPVEVYTAPPSAPSGLNVTEYGEDFVTLAWTNPGTLPANGGVHIKRRITDSGDAFVRVGSVVAGSSSYADTSVNHSTGYDYQVTCYNSNPSPLPDSETDPSNTVAVTTLVETVPPSLDAAEIIATGLGLKLTLSESALIGTGGAGGIALTASGGAITATYSSGSGTTVFNYTLSRTIYPAETVAVAYTQPGNGIEDAVGNDMESFTGFAATNNSEAIPYLIAEDFEGATPANDPSGAAPVTSTGVTHTSTNPLVGSQSMMTNSAFASRVWTLAGDLTGVWLFVALKPGGGFTNGIVELLNNSNVVQFSAEFRTDRVVGNHGSVPSATLGGAVASESRLWIRYVAETVPGSSNDGILTLYINKNSSSEVRPAPTGDTGFSFAVGNGDAVRKIRLRSANTTAEFRFDKLRVATTEIGDNPI